MEKLIQNVFKRQDVIKRINEPITFYKIKTKEYGQVKQLKNTSKSKKMWKNDLQTTRWEKEKKKKGQHILQSKN